MSFSSPYLLLTLLLVPLVATLAIVARLRQARYPVSFTNVDLLAEVAGPRGHHAVRRWVPLVMLLLGLAVAGAAIAKPQITTTVTEGHAVVVMLVDTSGSMQATDVRPSRIGAAVTAMQGFINRLPAGAEVGLIEFSDQPQVISLPTVDHAQVLDSLQYLSPNGATALGDSISTAVAVVKSTGAYARARRLVGAKDAPGAIVLLSDGAQDRGTVTPGQAARQAKAADIPIYAIAFGTPTGKVHFEGYGTIAVPPDPQTMKQIAQISGGKAFNAQTASQATSIYNGLGSALDRERKERSLVAWFVVVAAILISGAALLSRVVGPALS